MQNNSNLSIIIEEKDVCTRLDVLVAKKTENLSRTYAADLIISGNILVNSNIKKPSYKVTKSDIITVCIPHKSNPPEIITPEPISLKIIYEDKYLIVINKPAGIVVHPSSGHSSNTIVNAILFHCPDIEGIKGDLRPGIVHRLDKDTSGTLVIAKNITTHMYLGDQFRDRKIRKEYIAIVYGRMEKQSGIISLPIGRHYTDRKKMSIKSRKTRNAETNWHIKELFSKASMLKVNPITGRTHQIRVHLKAIGHPVIGDEVYGKSINTSILAKRQMLHAAKLSFIHPKSGIAMDFESPIPDDMKEVIEQLRNV
ncbi:MAG: RluA family pseudouridine synthase [Desulfobacterales bacterium]|nr:RluA family pseudouridine synthase [Desulfobacterales bacterium]MBF0397514.1 RluA family pseudouridine synthase [Desulfobacterales bacterium]